VVTGSPESSVADEIGGGLERAITSVFCHAPSAKSW
jgi:hypothetical protein